MPGDPKPDMWTKKLSVISVIVSIMAFAVSGWSAYLSQENRNDAVERLLITVAPDGSVPLTLLESGPSNRLLPFSTGEKELQKYVWIVRIANTSETSVASITDVSIRTLIVRGLPQDSATRYTTAIYSIISPPTYPYQLATSAVLDIKIQLLFSHATQPEAVVEVSSSRGRKYVEAVPLTPTESATR